MPVFNAWNVNRSVKKAIVADSMDEFIVKARQKLNIDENSVVIYIEEDGTEVDDDETFMAYEPKTTFVVATNGQEWQPRQISQPNSKGQGQNVSVEGMSASLSNVVQPQISSVSNQLTIEIENGQMKLGDCLQMLPTNVGTASGKATVSFNHDELKEKSKIFGKDSQRECTKYENAVNEAAYDLCIDDITLVSDRKRLFEKAREKVNLSGYSYKKNKSRSKVFGDGEAVPPKKIKLAQEIRKRRVDEISEDLASTNDTISMLEKQRQRFAGGGKYIQAAEMIQQISEQRKKIRNLQLELGKLQKKESRSKKYYAKKSSLSQNQSITNAMLTGSKQCNTGRPSILDVFKPKATVRANSHQSQSVVVIHDENSSSPDGTQNQDDPIGKKNQNFALAPQSIDAVRDENAGSLDGTQNQYVPTGKKDQDFSLAQQSIDMVVENASSPGSTQNQDIPKELETGKKHQNFSLAPPAIVVRDENASSPDGIQNQDVPIGKKDQDFSLSPQ